MSLAARLRSLERRASPAADAERNAAALIGALTADELDALAGGPLTEAEFVEICDRNRERERAGLPLCPPATERAALLFAGRPDLLAACRARAGL